MSKKLLKVRIKDKKIPAKKRKLWEGIIGKALVKAMVRQDIRELYE
jgi:hypothetical protein